MTTCHHARQKYPTTRAGTAANGSRSFATKMTNATFKVSSDIELRYALGKPCSNRKNPHKQKKAAGFTAFAGLKRWLVPRRRKTATVDGPASLPAKKNPSPRKAMSIG